MHDEEWSVHMEKTLDVGRPADSQWWRDSQKIQRHARGVFEGGGAKGILYVGALEGVLRSHTWFSAVAGASAGAITATLIAAGMTPDEMRREMKAGLDTLAPARFTNAWRRLRHGAGFLDHEALDEWLKGVLRDQCLRFGITPSSSSPTFTDLHAATGIDLFVVAADLSTRQVMVFNRVLTPKADVAGAVAASATIPFAFTPRLFGVLSDEESQGRRHHLVADGGIAANYPAFVFRDEAFRSYVGLGAIDADEPVLGFLLDEEPDRRRAALDVYRRGQFLGTPHDLGGRSLWSRVPRFRRARLLSAGTGLTARALRLADSLLYVLERLVLVPLNVLAWLVAIELPWLWSPPSNRHTRVWMDALRTWLSAAPGALILGVTAFTVMFAIGFRQVATSVVAGIVGYRPDEVMDAIGFIAMSLIALAALALAFWIFLLGLGSLALLRVLAPTIGLVGRPLLRTFLQTPAAPPWTGYGRGETVIRLQVPTGLTTLGAARGVNVDAAISDAADAAFQALQRPATDDGVVASPARS